MPNVFDAKGYSLSGKIMLSCIILLFFIVVLMVCLHIYARWYLLRARRRHHHHHNLRRRQAQLVFYPDPTNPTTLQQDIYPGIYAAAVSFIAAAPRGLEASVITLLPVFSYDPKAHPEGPPECAVCLSEFESGETGRVLPKCKHAFHTDCIDMWFHSHSTCPLCRTLVEPEPENQTQTRPELVLVDVPEHGSSSGSGLETENRTGPEVSSSSVGSRRKPPLIGVTVEVPPRSESFNVDGDSPSSQSSFRSPMSRMLSLKRILSREWKGSVSPSSSGGGGCSSVSAVECIDVERGEREETQ